jgi:hypothetical protein
LRHKRAIKPDSGKKIEVQFLLPKLVRHSGKAASRRVGTADVVDQDVDAAEFPQYGLGNLRHAFRGAEVRLNENVRCESFREAGTCGGGDHGSAGGEPAHHGFACSLGAAGYQDTLPRKLTRIHRILRRLLRH